MYFGLRTSANKTRWVVFGVLKVISIIFAIAWIVVKAELTLAYDDCFQSQGCLGSLDSKGGDTWYCFHRDEVVSYCNDKNSDGPWVAYRVLLAAWILCLIASIVPLIVMAFTKKPPMQASYYVVQMETYDQLPLRANPPHV
eukprot:TRINITY_DN690_c1_g1_i9.p3 TRINITY_DN690_c1_g1~~TRINITY_DN690_c1_g1_i9.p3  ORF type:complete len:141 (-),score=5.63 TRINITY_DN690_c1_g1_i9:246-668(-)